MIIVVEGIDNSGKSTLVKHLSDHFGYTVQPSEGPPKYDGEMNVRLERYARMYSPFFPIIFDRHPIVSQTIYRTIRTGHDPVPMREDLIKNFYALKPLFIYCDPLDRGMSGHVFNEDVDTEEHLRQVDEGYRHMLQLYRDWAIKHAHIIYRIGDSVPYIIHCVDCIKEVKREIA